MLSPAEGRLKCVNKSSLLPSTDGRKPEKQYICRRKTFTPMKLTLALGTNFEQEDHMDRAVEALEEFFQGDIIFSPSMWTEPVGLPGSDMFLNRLARADTSLDLVPLVRGLKRIEAACGRTPGRKACGRIDMDIDVLAYGPRRYHDDDWSRPYVARLLKELP